MPAKKTTTKNKTTMKKKTIRKKKSVIKKQLPNTTHPFYCLKCQKRIEVVPTGKPKKTKSGSWMLHSRCGECTTRVHTFISSTTKSNM